MYRLLCLLSVVVFLALFVLLLINPGTYTKLYGVPPDLGADFLGRRASPMFLGIAVLLWMARGFAAGGARDAVCYCMIAIWFVIAATGLYEFAVGTASVAIVGAAALEAGLGIGFLIARRQ